MSGVSVSVQADPVCIINMYPAPVPSRQVAQTPLKGTTHCQMCQVKFTPAAKRANCAGCGLLLCLKTCLTGSRPMPTLGYPKPTAVCQHCMIGEPYEPVEDIVLWSAQKSEIVAMVRKVYKRVMGNKIPININNNCAYQLYGEPQQRTAVFMLNPELHDAQLYVGPWQLIIHCASGIAQARIQEIEKARAERSKAALERHRREQEEEKKKEEQKEREREELRKKQLEERKKQKQEMLERAEVERQAKERERQTERERSARIVAERANRF